MPSQADGICAGGMCSTVLHNLYDTTQYGKQKKKRTERGHLAYLEILSGGGALDGQASGQEARCVSVGPEPATTKTAARSYGRLRTAEGVNNLRCSVAFSRDCRVIGRL